MARAGKSGQKAMGEAAGLGRGGYQQTDVDPGVTSEEKVKNLRQVQRGTRPGQSDQGKKTKTAQKVGGRLGTGA
ncbi:MAG TPA: hypothetical protein VGQ81_02200 [Acidobacteriota bacterium]|jgi:hypothetical protein|nr:hypothetical protein [Acidobacteriota bacterium]